MKVLVTGGGGFLGGAVVERLVARGDQVTSLQRGHYPKLAALGVKTVAADLADAQAVRQATRGCDAVVHVAAKAGAWGPYADYHRANVLGTQHIIEACRDNGVGRLVFTSSPSVTHRATAPVEGGDETTPYGEDFKAHYPATKRAAEEAVLAANSRGLATVALRPRLIFGPGDTQILPRLVARARAGRLRIVGDGRNLIDTTFIDNAADAHILSLDALGLAQPACAGRPYFISNGEPRPAQRIVADLLAAVGVAPPERHISFRAAYGLGRLLEGLWSVLPLKGEPPMTRFLAEQLSTPHWYDIGAAQRDFGYLPKVSIDEGLRRLTTWARTAEGQALLA